MLSRSTNRIPYVAWSILSSDKGTALDAVEIGCSACERSQCDGSVGYGGSPDETGDVRLDAMIMDGSTMNTGAVASLRNIRNAIGVARHVLENTKHSLLVGDRAYEFALAMGFPEELTATDHSQQMWTEWRARNCQPNFWNNVSPDPIASCGPYTPLSENDVNYKRSAGVSPHFGGASDHDTIGMVAVDGDNNVVAGTSTNGASFKIAG